MKSYRVSELSDRLLTHGRVLRDAAEDILYMNWSCSGVEFTFSGTHLSVSLRAACGLEYEGPLGTDAPPRPTWPWLAVFLDGAETPARRFEIASEAEDWLVFASEKPETHRIRLLKLTENYKTFLGIAGFAAEGAFLPTEPRKTKRVEIIGDSITCGYGNLTLDPLRHFYAAEEDGSRAYGAAAARSLGFEWSCVSVSGITAVRHRDWQIPFAMEELYAWTDRVWQDKRGQTPEAWDFAAHPSDYVVLNLGTNDRYAIQYSPDPAELERFPAQYLAFLREIRRLNGPNTQIVCALGSMCYYLWHDIAETVARYQRETGDERVHLLRFRPMHPLDGAGADGHPSLVTQAKMAAELAAFLRELD